MENNSTDNILYHTPPCKEAVVIILSINCRQIQLYFPANYDTEFDGARLHLEGEGKNPSPIVIPNGKHLFIGEVLRREQNKHLVILEMVKAETKQR